MFLRFHFLSILYSDHVNAELTLSGNCSTVLLVHTLDIIK